MILKTIFGISCMIFSAALSAQGDFYASVYLKGFISDSTNSFWSYSNTNGLVSPHTRGVGVLSPEYSLAFKNEDTLRIGGSVFFAYNEGIEDDWAFNQYYATWQHNKIGVTLGAKQLPEKLLGLSAVGGDILWSSNARPIPGLRIGTTMPVRIMEGITAEGEIAHFHLNPERIVRNAYIHHKQMQVNFRISRESELALGFHHYVQWGGVSEESGEQTGSLSDFARIFIPDVSSSADEVGNHLGSYRIKFTHDFRYETLQLYHQSIIEDQGGFLLDNFPDGVWGIFLKRPESLFLNGILYEYIQTTARSGGDPALGFDNYFNNTIYRGGWTYFGSTIGMPFIIPAEDGVGVINNVLQAHHLGIMGEIIPFTYRVKGSYVQNFGLNEAPLAIPEENFYTYFELRYQTDYLGRFGLSLGYDINEPAANAITLGLEYLYVFETDSDRCRCRY